MLLHMLLQTLFEVRYSCRAYLPLPSHASGDAVALAAALKAATTQKSFVFLAFGTSISTVLGYSLMNAAFKQIYVDTGV